MLTAAIGYAMALPMMLKIGEKPIERWPVLNGWGLSGSALGRIMRQAACLLAVLAAMQIAALGGAAAQDDTPNAANEPISTQRAVIRFLTANDYPPFNSLDEDGVLTGLNVDLARAICLDLATTCDIQARPWAGLLGDLAKGRSDAVIAAHRVTADALKRVDFSNRYFFTPARFATHRDTSQLVPTPRGLDGLQAGVVANSPHEAFLTRHFRNTRVKRYNTPELARLALQNKQVDLVFDDGIGLAFWANGSLSRGCCRLLVGAYFEPAYFGDGLAIAVGKNDRALRGQLNAALRRIKRSGRFNELVERYFPIKVY
ncbi:MAG: polar amino acid transport system substrate-binding protein [Hyphomicrobiaceae bacterium]|jgi:polar amino acid transport system substrate-binding protein